MSLPDLGLVAVFVRVVELDSFTAAATALGLPKSSVSRSVAQLEEALGVRLLQRTSRKLSLTDSGRAFYERVRDPLTGVVEAMTDATEENREPRGTIRFTAPPDLGLALLAPLLAEFARKYPHIHVDVMLTTRLVDLIAERFDLALRATKRLDDSTLVARRIGAITAALFASPAYLKREGTPRSIADLAAHKCVLFRANDGRSSLRLQGPGGEEVVEVRGPISTDDIGFVRRAVLEGAGIGLLPHQIVSEQDKLVPVLPAYSLEGAVLYLVMPSGRHVPTRVRLLRDFLAERLGHSTAKRA
jgi:DNA-binding transcriptional LysR family regulator